MPAVAQQTRLAFPSRGRRREAAAEYIGVSPSKFDEMVKDGRMPKPKRIDGCRVWDVLALDRFFDALPGGDESDHNAWDE